MTSAREDDQLARLRAALTARGADAVLFDPARLPSEANVRVAYEGANKQAVLQLDGRELDLSRVCAVWWQRPGLPQAPSHLPAEQRAWASDQAKALLDSIWDGLDVLWVPGRRRQALAADGKARQLEVAQRAGLRVPRTLITSDPAQALAFYDACQGRVISKVLRSGRVMRDGEKHLAYSHVVRRRDLQRLASVADAPVIFQELLPKRIELRIVVVGERVFSAAIDSQASPFAREDFRRADHLVACTSHILDREVAAHCVRLVRDLELTSGGIDMVLTPEGEHVFLEINPSGKWDWLEDRAGLPIADALADLMLSGRRAR